jgi:1-acyl-sn-glycerol-3-phosphate acyltransferase
VIKRLTRLLCRVDDAQLARIPPRGPLIVVSNHVNFLDAPVFYTHMLPRRVIALTKVETFNSLLLGFLATTWGAIPLQRGEADLSAVKRALQVLKGGGFLAIAPEGTRSGNGCLQRAQPGVVLLALQSGAPLLPVAFFGGERFRQNVSRLRRTDFHIAVGRPFTLSAGVGRSSHALRQEMLNQIMYQIAALLPSAYRGEYASPPPTVTSHLRFSGE